MSATALHPTDEVDQPFTTDVDILLIDDDEQWAWATAQLLESTADAFVVETAFSREAGLDQFRESHPDCVVCDYQLGDGTGFDLLDAIRETHPQLPFILITGRGDEHVASDALGRGATDYIPKDIDDDEGTVLASRVRRIVQAYRTERQLERERQSKNALLNLVTATSNLSDLHERCCTVLSDVHGYEGVWIGTASRTGVVPEAIVGCEDYIDAAVPPDTDVDTGDPGVTALSTGEAVYEAVNPSASADHWHQLAADRGITAAAAVPIQSDTRLFGVITVYADESITDQQQALLTEFADLLGYVHHTSEWKQSLLSGGSVNVEIEIEDEAVPLVALGDHLPENVTVEVPSVVDRNDGTTAYLARISGLPSSEIESRVSDCSLIELVDYSPESDVVRCDLRTTATAPEQILTERNMYFDKTVFENGTVTVSGRLSDVGSVKQLTQVLESHYDGVRTSTVWSDTTIEGSRSSDHELLESLTDRQLEILQHAFYDNYFEIPRGSSATELSERFDIARATFTQHLRAAQRKILKQLFVEE